MVKISKKTDGQFSKIAGIPVRRLRLVNLTLSLLEFGQSIY
jgi:hypothetical protein